MDGTRILVIAHSANQWALDHLLLGADLADARRGRHDVAAGLGVRGPGELARASRDLTGCGCRGYRPCLG